MPSPTPATPPTLKDLARRVRFRCSYGARLPWEAQDEWQRDANGYTCVLAYQKRQYTVDFWMGVAHTKEPTAMDVLDCLLSDAQAGQQSFEEFCSDFGYDSDSRKAEATWRACRKAHKNLRRLLGANFDAFMAAERD